MPTIGQLVFFFFRLERDVARRALDCIDFLRPDFVRESPARRFGVRFAVMAAFYVNCVVPVTQASIAP